jgi:hypothetical protein
MRFYSTENSEEPGNIGYQMASAARTCPRRILPYGLDHQVTKGRRKPFRQLWLIVFAKITQPFGADAVNGTRDAPVFKVGCVFDCAGFPLDYAPRPEEHRLLRAPAQANNFVTAFALTSSRGCFKWL